MAEEVAKAMEPNTDLLEWTKRDKRRLLHAVYCLVTLSVAMNDERSRADVNTPPQSQTVRHLLFKDETPLHSSTINTAAEPPSVIPLLDPSPSTMSKEDDPLAKRHCPSKSHDD
ncbi:hypothetical protein OIU76_016515 [Salix suchowensis]|nr:hypothetical protein OIU76_016515 [Salix suchowensis]